MSDFLKKLFPPPPGLELKRRSIARACARETRSRNAREAQRDLAAAWAEVGRHLKLAMDWGLENSETLRRPAA